MKKIILGIAMLSLGTFAFAQTTNTSDAPKKEFKKQKMDPAKIQEMKEARLLEMKQQLGLSDAQVSQLRTLDAKRSEANKANWEANKAERQQKMTEMKDRREQNEKEMKSILSQDQYTKWQAMRADKMKQRKDKMNDRKPMTGSTK